MPTDSRHSAAVQVDITHQAGRKNSRGSERGGAPLHACGDLSQGVAAPSPAPRARSIRREAAERKLSVPGPEREAIAARFWAKTSPEPNTGCLLWTGSLHRLGYGEFRVGDVVLGAHRVAFLLACAALPPGYEAAHRCDVRWCVEPRHLYRATHAENLRDCAQRERGREARGEANSAARLTEGQVRELRALHRTSRVGTAELAAQFGISKAHVRAIVSGSRWTHLGVAP